MSTLNIFLKCWNTAIHTQTLTSGCGMLHHYFQTCVELPVQNLFKSVQVSINPHWARLTDYDILVYIVPGDGKNGKILPPGVHAGRGGKTDLQTGEVVSEVWMNVIKEEGGDRYSDQGEVLAKLAFHEIAHNKTWGLKASDKFKKMSQKEQSRLGDSHHAMNKDLKDLLGPSPLKVLDLAITDYNLRWMAALITYPVKQCTRYLWQRQA